jgi:hypothetical protein
MRNRNGALPRLLRDTGILSNEHIAETAQSSSRTLAGLVQKAWSPSKSTAAIDPVLVGSGPRCAIPPASQCGGRGARLGAHEPPGSARWGPLRDAMNSSFKAAIRDAGRRRDGRRCLPARATLRGSAALPRGRDQARYARASARARRAGRSPPASGPHGRRW